MYKKYESLGLGALYNDDFDTAKYYFSLAYEKSQKNKFLFLIELSEAAKINSERAKVILDFFQLNEQDVIDEYDWESFFGFINNIYNENEEHKETENTQGLNSIYYDELSDIAKNGDFKKIFQNIIFSTTLSFTNKDEVLNFLDDLVENDFLDMSLNYIENAAHLYIGNKKFEKILEKIKKNENSNSK